MNVAVIGAGNIGGTLAVAWARAGHTVTVAGSHGTAALVARFAGTTVTVRTLDEVAAGADVVVVSIPFIAVPELRSRLAALAGTVTVVDTTNYVPGLRDDAIDAVDDGEVESAWVSRSLGRPVVKAFNTVGAATLRDRTTQRPDDVPIAVPVAADRAEDRRRVEQLIADAGFEAVDDGAIADSWRQQPGTPVYTADLSAVAALQALRRADRADNDAWRQRVGGPGS